MTIAQAKAKHKASRLLPCGCRVVGTGSNPSPYINCPEADRLTADARRLLNAGEKRWPEAQEAIESSRLHRTQTPVYLGGGKR